MTKTVGKIALDLQQEIPQKLKLREQVEAMQADYMKYLLDAVDRGYKKYTTDFFIEVQTKNEKLLHNVFRNYFIDRLSCPTPNYDQSVFRYNREKGQVEYLWTIPSRDTAHHLKDNALEVSSQPNEKGLLEFVLKFDSGELFKMMKQYNNEKLETPELINLEYMNWIDAYDKLPKGPAIIVAIMHASEECGGDPVEHAEIVILRSCNDTAPWMTMDTTKEYHLPKEDDWQDHYDTVRYWIPWEEFGFPESMILKKN